MKNKKLFAILTLVAFMLTMMPVMAFATTSGQIGAWVEDGNALVSEDAVADSSKAQIVEFCVDVPNTFDGTNESLYVFATIAGTNEVFPINGSGQLSVSPSATDVNGEGLLIKAGGEYTIKFVNARPAQIDLKAVLVKGTKHDKLSIIQVINKYEIGKDGTNTFANVAFDGNNTVKFTSTTVATPVITAEVKINGQGSNLSADDTTATDGSGVVVEREYDGDVLANNGLDVYKVTVELTQGGVAVKNAEIAVGLNKVGAFLSSDVITTNNRGVASFNVYASKAGVYTVNLAYGDAKDLDLVLDFNSAAVETLTPAEVTGHFATITPFYIDITGTDMNGNALSVAEVATALTGGAREFQFVKAPEASAFDLEAPTALLAGSDFAVGTNPVTGNTALVIKTAVPGDYTVKMYAPTTGRDVKYINFSTKKYDKTVQAVVAYGSNTYYLGSAVPAPSVTTIDANGTKKTLTGLSGVQLAYTGVGVTNWSNGAFTVTTNEDYLGKEIVITAVVDDCFATTTLKIADVPAYLNFTDTKAAVGTEATVPVVSLDLNGNLAALGTVTFSAATDVTAVVTNKPAGAIVSVDYANTLNKFATTGKGAIKVASNKPGTVTVNVIVKADTNGGAAGGEVYLTGIATVNFGEEATPVQQSATLIIGSNVFVANGGVQTAPVAPAIIDGRTYLPIRAVGQAIGAQVDYADGIITLTLGTQKATMAPGSNVMTVGTQTVTMDAAPYLAGDNTMVPVRYAAQAFGYELGTTTNADGSVATVTIFK